MEVVFVTESYYKNQASGETNRLSDPIPRIILGGPGACPAGKILENWTLGKRHILHSLDRTQLIYTCILLSFSLSLIIHDSRAEVQRFMILTYFVSMIHDSASTPNLVSVIG